MHEQVADIFDVVLFVLAAVICLQTGVQSVVKDNQEVQKYTSSYSEKNTTQKYTPSEKIYGEYDGSLTKEDLALVTQIQDYEMFGPHSLTYGVNKVELHPGYEMYTDQTRNKLWTYLSGDDADTAYSVDYDHKYGTYRISKKTEKTEGK